MSEISLFEHNEIAYQKLIEALKTSRSTTINHATGTGKSFIALKYLYEHRDKKYLYRIVEIDKKPNDVKNIKKTNDTEISH